MKRFLLYLVLLSLLGFKGQALKFYTLSNFDNVGDHNQVLGVAAAFRSLSPQNFFLEDLDVRKNSAEDIAKKVEHDLFLNEEVIVVGAGEGGIQGIKELPKNDNLTVCLTAHMLLQDHKDPNALKKVDFIALPAHVSKEVKATLESKLIETIGVAHNRQPEDADKAYAEWKKKLPVCSTYVGVYLGGDAPTFTKEIKHFTEDDVIKLANYISQKAKDACILVMNGPRTGKYDNDGKEISKVHRNGVSDRVTRVFLKELETRNIKNVKVFDFQYNAPENKPYILPYNSFDLVIGALRAKGGKIIVPGESTSVVSEAVDTLFPGQVLVYENSAMNEVHQAHIASELAAGRVSVLRDYKTVDVPQSSSSNSLPSAAMTIAQKIWEKVNQ